MAFTPQNAAVYIAAMTGAMSSLAASNRYATDGVAADYAAAAVQADAFAQEVDALFATSGQTLTQVMLNTLSENASSLWNHISPLQTNANVPSAYAAVAAAVVAIAIEASAQVASEGVNPNIPAGIANTSATVTGGQTYTVKTTDSIIKMDSSNGAVPTATLPAPSYIGEAHTFFWYGWSAAQIPPVINADAGHKMSTIPGMASSGAAGLVTTTNFTQPGQFYTIEWTGAEWLQTG